MARILVIDDDPLLRRMACAVLGQAGHEVAHAADGAEGLRAFGARPADLVLCDLFMPEKDGLETITELRRDSPGPRIVAMSGGGFLAGVDVLAESLRRGADRALPKPFRPADLLAAVGEVLGAPAAPRGV